MHGQRALRGRDGVNLEFSMRAIAWHGQRRRRPGTHGCADIGFRSGIPKLRIGHHEQSVDEIAKRDAAGGDLVLNRLRRIVMCKSGLNQLAMSSLVKQYSLAKSGDICRLFSPIVRLEESSRLKPDVQKRLPAHLQLILFDIPDAVEWTVRIVYRSEQVADGIPRWCARQFVGVMVQLV